MKKKFFQALLKSAMAIAVLPTMVADAVKDAFEGETVEVSMDTSKKFKTYSYKKVSA